MGMMKRPFCQFGAIVFMLSLLAACVGGQSGQGSAENAKPEGVVTMTESGVEKQELASIEDMVAGSPLTAKYDNVIIGSFTSSEQIQTDYPEAAADCEKQVVKQLKSRNSYKNVTEEDGKTFPGKTAVVNLKIIDMRITSGAARMWGGVFAGSSFMEVLLQIRDAGSDTVLHEKILTTSNNAWAASYSGGSSDVSLPSDFGVLIGEYLSKVIPTK